MAYKVDKVEEETDRIGDRRGKSVQCTVYSVKIY